MCTNDHIKEKPDKKTADLNELKSALPHPYITGQGLKRETGKTGSPGDSHAPADSDASTD